MLSDISESDQDCDNHNNDFVPLEDYDSSHITH
jgi:hypothetical protein